MARRTRERRFAVFFPVMVCFGFAGNVAAQSTAPTPSATSAAPDFSALVKKGDQARIAGKWSEALHAYAEALEIRDDALVAGRLGLVLLEFREYQAAAGKLFQAVEVGAGASDTERTRFFQAYLVAKNQVCRLDVVILQNGVKFEIDDEPRLEGRHDFWTFVQPGKHNLHASLEGFEDQTIEIDAPKGSQLPIKIELHPVKPKEEPAKQPEPEPLPKPTEPPLHGVKPVPDVVNDNPTAPTNSRPKNGSFVVGLGGGFVLGATPTPAVGPDAFVAWRSRSWWEVGLDGRVAWTLLTDKRAPTTQFVTWSAMVVPCGRWWKRRVLTCGLLQLDGTQRTDGVDGRLLPGFGLRGGVEFGAHERLAIQIVVDGIGHHRGFSFRTQEGISLGTGSIITGSLLVRAVIKP